MNTLHKNDVIRLRIEALAFGGQGVAHTDEGFTVFVRNALPEQEVDVKIVKKRKNYAEAIINRVVSASRFQVEPRCSYYGACGGCLLQHLDYAEQLVQKQRQVIETIEHIGGFQDLTMLSIMPSPEQYYYRNKMEFSFSNRRWLTHSEISSQQIFDNNFCLGLHAPGRFDKVVDVHCCFLLSERSNLVLNQIRAFAKNSQLAPYTTQDHSGYWRFVVIRESKQLDGMMVNLVTAADSAGDRLLEQLAQQLTTTFPFITTVVHNINKKKAQIAVGDEERILFGPGYIEEKLDDLIYRISANSFFQTNSAQAENMYRLIAQWGDFNKDQVVYDLYCGAGSIALFIANKVQKVVGFEIVAQALRDAELNSRINRIANCEFVEGDLKDQFADPAKVLARYDWPAIIIIDPPRSGMHPSLPDKIVQLQPNTIFYVSCNPATLARDLKLICQDKYRIDLIQPIDMFPHTAHCETVVRLLKK